MKIKLLISRAGTDFSQDRGDVIDISDDEAIRMIEADQAVAYSAKDEARLEKARKDAETAALEAMEKAEIEQRQAAENAARVEAAMNEAKEKMLAEIAAERGKPEKAISAKAPDNAASNPQDELAIAAGAPETAAL